MVWMKLLWLELLGCLFSRPAADLLGGTNMLLFTNDYTPGPNTTLADLDEPTYLGYVRAAVTLTGPYQTPDGKLGVHVPDTEWVLPAAQPGQTFYGMGIVDGAGALVMASRFAAPVTLPAPLTATYIGGEFILDPGQSLGVSDVEP